MLVGKQNNNTEKVHVIAPKQHMIIEQESLSTTPILLKTPQSVDLS